MRQNAPLALMALLSTLLGGCIQYSDTLNRPQVSTLPADGGMTVFDQNHAMPMADTPQTQTVAATAQSGKYHPNVVAYFRKSCESSYGFAMEEDPSRALNMNDCRYSAADIERQFADHVVYQDKDVAVVVSPSYFDEYGNSGNVPFGLLDLQAPAGQDELFWCEGHNVKASRKGSRITMSFISGKKTTEVFDLKKKSKKNKECKALRG